MERNCILSIIWVLFFGNYPVRYLYNHGYATTAFTDWTFEINDSGHPYYVVITYEKKVDYYGSDANGVITIDVQTGEIKSYNINEIPSWIDRVQPKNFIVDQLNDWGNYVGGWLNSWTSKEEVIKVTDGMSLVYDANGKSYW